MGPLVVFVIEDLPFALPLDRVARAVRAVAIRPLPSGPEIVCGVINLQGSIVPVVNARRRLGLTERELEPGDQMLIVRSATRTLAMIVDRVNGVADWKEDVYVPIETVIGGTSHVKGIIKRSEGMVLIQDLDSFLSLAEEQTLEAALSPVL